MNDLELIPSLVVGIDKRFFKYIPLEENKTFKLTPSLYCEGDTGYIDVEAQVEGLSLNIEGYFATSKLKNKNIRNDDIYDVSLFISSDKRVNTTSEQDYDSVTVLAILLNSYKKQFV